MSLAFWIVILVVGASSLALAADQATRNRRVGKVDAATLNAAAAAWTEALKKATGEDDAFLPVAVFQWLCDLELLWSKDDQFQPATSRQLVERIKGVDRKTLGAWQEGLAQATGGKPTPPYVMVLLVQHDRMFVKGVVQEKG
jgi:hypothetical protein